MTVPSKHNRTFLAGDADLIALHHSFFIGGQIIAVGPSQTMREMKEQERERETN